MLNGERWEESVREEKRDEREEKMIELHYKDARDM